LSKLEEIFSAIQTDMEYLQKIPNDIICDVEIWKQE